MFPGFEVQERNVTSSIHTACFREHVNRNSERGLYILLRYYLKNIPIEIQLPLARGEVDVHIGVVKYLNIFGISFSELKMKITGSDKSCAISHHMFPHNCLCDNVKCCFYSHFFPSR
jgi:hypothetical protein